MASLRSFISSRVPLDMIAMRLVSERTTTQRRSRCIDLLPVVLSALDVDLDRYAIRADERVVGLRILGDQNSCLVGSE